MLKTLVSITLQLFVICNISHACEDFNCQNSKLLSNNTITQNQQFINLEDNNIKYFDNRSIEGKESNISNKQKTNKMKTQQDYNLATTIPVFNEFGKDYIILSGKNEDIIITIPQDNNILQVNHFKNVDDDNIIVKNSLLGRKTSHPVIKDKIKHKNDSKKNIDFNTKTIELDEQKEDVKSEFLYNRQKSFKKYSIKN